MGRFRGDLPDRTFDFGLAVLELADALPNNAKGWVVGKQLIKSGTSIGANICEAEEALTDAEFVHKCSIARKEAGETRYWLRLSREGALLTEDRTDGLLVEVDEILRILVTIIRKMHARSPR